MMTSFQSLPYDLIYHIFNTDYISAADLLKLSSVCQVFNCVASENGLWRNKFKKKWPDCESLLTSTSDGWKTIFKWRWPRYESLFMSTSDSWKMQFRIRSYCERKVRQKLFQLTTDCYHVENIPLKDIEDLYDLVQKERRCFLYIMDELQIFMKNRSQDYLPERFYSDRVWRYMQIKCLELASLDYVKHPEWSSVFEGATLACMWVELFEPRNTAKIADQVKEISKQVLSKVQESYPDHPMNHLYEHDWKVPPQTFWGTSHCEQILKSIYEVMFGSLNFQIDITEAGCFSVEKAVENCRGTKEISAVIFSEVALHLGILTYPISLTGTSFEFLKWKPNPKKCPGEVYYMDLEDAWISKDSDFIKQFMVSRSIAADPEEPEYKPLVVFFLLVEQALRFHYELFFRNYTCVRKAIHYCKRVFRCIQVNDQPDLFRLFNIIFVEYLAVFLLNVRDPKPTTMVSRLQAEIPDEKFADRHKHRHNQPAGVITYAIGMLMKHKRELYRCVIYSWDAAPSDEWLQFTNPLRRLFQPHYRVLLDDGDVRYVPQDDLEMDHECTPINSIKVGKYFKAFKGNYYEPTNIAKSVYVEDGTHRKKILQRHREHLQNQLN